MLRSKSGVKWRNAEWLAITGTVLSSIAAAADSSDRCETSTMMPSRFISATTCLPNGLRPGHLRPKDGRAACGGRVGQAVEIRGAAVELKNKARYIKSTRM